MEKIFNLKKQNLKLKIRINEKYITTSWLHFSGKEFSNERKFNIEQLDFAFQTLKPNLDNIETENVKKFMFNKKEGEQISLF